MPISESLVRNYQIARDELKVRCPKIWTETSELCLSVPEKIQVSNVWQRGKDKPCWSNIQVAVGKRISSDLLLSEDFNSHTTIASDEWEIVMRERGRRWKANENFELRGRIVKAFIHSLTPGGLKSFLWKMYAIRNLAVALESDTDVRSMVSELAGIGHLPAEDLTQWTDSFSRHVGMGWGPVTVYHLLTDLGVAVKPDLHLVRSAVRMGLLSPQVPSDVDQEGIDMVSEHSVVVAVIELSKSIKATACPSKPNTSLREVDKVLMEWSRQGLARPL